MGLAPQSRSIPPAVDELLRLNGVKPAVVVVSCGKAKTTVPTSAENLYVSSLFRSSVATARLLAPSYNILSARYGLLDPEDPVAPYDLTISQLGPREKMAWGERVVSELLKKSRPDNVVSLAGETYNTTIAPALAREGIEFFTPLYGLGVGRRMAALKAVRRIYARLDLAKSLYDTLAATLSENGAFTLREFLLRRDIPKRGLYIFLDPSEPSSIHPSVPRIVRIGTHAVSTGSTSTLRTRLRTHLGQANLAGSHRSSIFRLHVGRALLKSEGMTDLVSTWGIGSVGSRDHRMEEHRLEVEVSRRLQDLLVVSVEISDAASARSFRAIAEKALIALFTEAGQLIERSSDTWLGNRSDRNEIRSTGLWNIQHVGKQTDFQAIRLLISLLTKTSAPNAAVHPGEAA